MLFHPRFSFLAAVALLAGVAIPVNRAAANTLSWGSLSPQYNPTTAQTTVRTNLATINGNTASIQFGNNSFFSNSTLNANSPASPATGTYGTGTNAYYADGGFTGKAALQIIADFDNSAGNIITGAAIPVTVFFSQPVSNLMFSFYDVDSGTFGGGVYTDYITNIFGLGTGGAAVRPISLGTGTAFTGSLGATSGSFTATGNNAQNATGGNASVTFGSTPITQFAFTYTDTASTPGGAAHSTLQIIALSDLTFTTVPEPSTWALAGVGAVAVGWLVRRQRGNRAAV